MYTPTIKDVDILVKKVKKHETKTAQAIFDAEVLKWRPIKKEWLRTKKNITCVGYFYDLVENDHLHIVAEETENPIYGPQLQIYTAERIQPGTVTEMVRFLSSIKGVGATTAKRLVDCFGLDVISKISEDMSCLNKLRLSQTAKENLYRTIIENRSYERLLIFLQLHQISPKYAFEIYKKYGSEAVEKICDNPYALYFDEVLDFPASARLDQSLDGDTARSYKIQALTIACLRDDSESNGNLCISISELPERLNTYAKKRLQDLTILLPTSEELDDALQVLAANRYIVEEHHISDTISIYLTKNYYSETTIADRTHTLLSSAKNITASRVEIDAEILQVQRETGFTLDAGQKNAILTALSEPVSILTGGPGTGKTQTLMMLIKTAQKLWADIDIRICAPTGKAAMRAQELTGINAATIHRTIGYPQNLYQQDELQCDLLIADEYSMCDAWLCSRLFQALHCSARLLIVGDHEQLPSVGPGLVLRDLIDSGQIQVTRLTEIHRQQGGPGRIIKNAHSIIKTPEGVEPLIDWAKQKREDFYMVPAKEQKRVQEMILKSVSRMLKEGFPLKEIAVLSPIHESIIGSDALNLALQEQLNPKHSGYSLKRGIMLKVSDKVIQTKNDYELSVFNGESGIIKEITYMPSKAILVSFHNRDVWYSSTQAEDLDLAYAITTHRAQGSEFQAVVIPIHPSLLFNTNKTLLYTAITRAKKRVVFVGSADILFKALQRTNISERKSNLILRLKA